MQSADSGALGPLLRDERGASLPVQHHGGGSGASGQTTPMTQSRLMLFLLVGAGLLTGASFLLGKQFTPCGLSSGHSLPGTDIAPW
jgi:hypothetical protein